MCLAGGTVFLQNEGLTDLPSVTMNQLKTPSLNRALTRRWRDEPSRGGGVNVRSGAGQMRPNQHRHSAAGFCGELQAGELRLV